MYKKLIFFTVCILTSMFLVGCSFSEDNNKNSSNVEVVKTNKITIEDIKAIRTQLAKIHNKDAKTATLTINKQIDDFVRGSINFGTGNEIFLAIKEDDQWVIVYNGLGKMSCKDVGKYKFPSEMISDCE